MELGMIDPFQILNTRTRSGSDMDPKITCILIIDSNRSGSKKKTIRTCSENF